MDTQYDYVWFSLPLFLANKPFFPVNYPYKTELILIKVAYLEYF